MQSMTEKKEGAGGRVRERGEGERLNLTVRVANLPRNGEGLSVEFKRCSGRNGYDVVEVICALGSWFDGRCVK